MQTSGGTATNYFFTGLPAGMTQSNSLISGTPTLAGTYTIGMNASNSCGVANQNFTLIVTSAGTGGVTLDSIPETGAFISREAGTILLYFFVLAMGTGSVLLLLWPRIAYARTRSSRGNKR